MSRRHTLAPLIAALVATGCARDHSPAAVPSTTPVAAKVDQASVGDAVVGTPTMGPTAVDAVGRPAGFGHSAEGARAAAIAYVSLTGEVMTAGFISRGDLLGDLATDRYRPELVESTGAEVRAVESRLNASGAAGQLVVAEHPLRARIDGATTDRVTVEVWSVLVLGVRDGAHVQQLWRTCRLAMAWEHEDWRVDDWSSTPGPTPAFVGEAGVSTVDEVAAVITWPAAVPGPAGPAGEGGSG